MLSLQSIVTAIYSRLVPVIGLPAVPLVLTHPRGHPRFRPLLGPCPMITVEVHQKQQCRDDLFINAEIQVQSSQMDWWMITCSQAKHCMMHNVGCC
jgi:hypothetical protein